MKIKQAPIADLLKHVGELYAEKPRYYRFKNIFDVIDKYYCSLTNHKTITPMGKDYLNGWCELNWAPTMENCPNVPGILVYRHETNGIRFGLLYHSGFITAGKQTNFLSYYDTAADGTIMSKTYLASEWEGWGAPVRYFYFDRNEYVDSNSWELGERSLSKLCMGHDVHYLQTLLKKFNDELIVTGVFDEKTIEVLNEVQKICYVPRTQEFDLNEATAQKVIKFLAGEK